MESKENPEDINIVLLWFWIEKSIYLISYPSLDEKRGKNLQYLQTYGNFRNDVREYQNQMEGKQRFNEIKK